MSDLERLSGDEIKMLMNPHYGFKYLESQGWVLNGNGYSRWLESDTSLHGIRRVSFPGWVNELIDSARKHGEESALRPIRDALGITDNMENEVFQRKVSK